jgi:DNA-binding NtrC family response regulator
VYQRYKELLALKKKMDPEGNYLGESLPVLEVFKTINVFNRSPCDPVLILGPSGAGKSAIAELIHRNSSRERKLFYHYQAACSQGGDLNIPKGQWAGYGEDHGLTNVKKDGTKGLLQLYAGGTIFIDEMAEFCPGFQTFLLDVLDRRPIPPAAGMGPAVTPNVRLIFATNQDLEEARQKHKLRQDLLRRLDPWVLTIPPLADRKSDIFLFVKAWCGEHRPEARFLLALLRHSWAGNVGELQAVLKRAVNCTRREDEPLSLDFLPLDRGLLDSVRQTPEEEVDTEVYRLLESVLSEQGYRKHEGLYQRMADLLKVSPATVTRKMKDPAGV